jgi:tetratricopeptide (TPR) repeat protein
MRADSLSGRLVIITVLCVFAGVLRGFSFNGEPGQLLDNKNIAASDLYDPARHVYLLYPGVYRANEVRTNSVQIGIIDSGIMIDHPQIKGLIAGSKDFTGDGIEDRIGHGTLVTLIFLYGVEESSDVPEVPSIIVAKVARKDGRILQEDVIKAIDWIAGYNVLLINISIGFHGSPQDYEPLREALERHPEVRFYCAAGNDGPDVTVYPAAFDLKNVISIGLVGTNGLPDPISGKAAVYRQLPPYKNLISLPKYEMFRGINALQKHNLREAAEFFYLTLKDGSPAEKADAHMELAHVDIEEKEFNEALEQNRLAAELVGWNDKLYNERGWIEILQGQQSSAEQDIKKAIEINSAEPLYYKRLGDLYVMEGKTKEALDQYVLALQLAPDDNQLKRLISKARYLLSLEEHKTNGN